MIYWQEHTAGHPDDNVTAQSLPPRYTQWPRQEYDSNNTKMYWHEIYLRLPDTLRQEYHPDKSEQTQR